MKLVGRIVLIIIILCILLFVGTCSWQNCRSPSSNSPKPPDANKAQYQVTEITGQQFFSDKVEVEQFPSYKIVTMYNYWEVTKGKYIYHKITLPLDERIFGKIEVKKR